MKLNPLQKICVFVYIILFIFFAIIHVPFKYSSNEISYETIFSTSAKLDFSRYFLILATISIIVRIIIMLLEDYQINDTTKLKISTIKQFFKKYRVSLFLTSLLIAISIFFVFLFKTQSNVSKTEITQMDSTLAHSDSAISPSPKPNTSTDEMDKNCTAEQALINFKSYMEFNFPDWKIYGTPVVQEQPNCKYRIQFKTHNPQETFDNSKDVVVVELSYNYNHTEYNVDVLRGYLY